jgi:hypothetical protein
MLLGIIIRLYMIDDIKEDIPQFKHIFTVLQEKSTEAIIRSLQKELLMSDNQTMSKIMVIINNRCCLFKIANDLENTDLLVRSS